MLQVLRLGILTVKGITFMTSLCSQKGEIFTQDLSIAKGKKKEGLNQSNSKNTTSLHLEWMAYSESLRRESRKIKSDKNSNIFNLVNLIITDPHLPYYVINFIFP